MIPKMASLGDYEEFAKRTLAKTHYDYINSFAEDGVAKHDNLNDFQLIKVRQRGMANVDHFKGTDTTLLGYKVNSPIGIAPMGQQMLLKMQGENATAIAAKDAGSAFVLSAWSNKPVEEVYHSSQGGLKLFELAPNLEVGVRNKILERVSKLVDFKGIVVSCDAYAQGKKENNIKNGFTLPPNMEKGTYNEYLKDTNDLGSNLTGRAFKFEDIKEIKKVCNLPVVVKGVMCQKDALEALKQGADAIWVSNQSGNTLDSAPSTISALGAIARAVRLQSVKKDADILFDGGIRRGTDVVKALALGANFVFIGKPAMWGLHYKGTEGVKEVLEVLNEELKLAMVLTDCMEIKQITAERVIHMTKAKL